MWKRQKKRRNDSWVHAHFTTTDIDRYKHMHTHCHQHWHAHIFRLRRRLCYSSTSILSSLTSARYRAQAHLFMGKWTLRNWLILYALDSNLARSLEMEQRTRSPDELIYLDKQIVYIDSIRLEWQYERGTHIERARARERESECRECVNIFVTQANIDMTFETVYTTFRLHCKLGSVLLKFNDNEDVKRIHSIA